MEFARSGQIPSSVGILKNDVDGETWFAMQKGSVKLCIWYLDQTWWAVISGGFLQPTENCMDRMVISYHRILVGPAACPIEH